MAEPFNPPYAQGRARGSGTRTGDFSFSQKTLYPVAREAQARLLPPLSKITRPTGRRLYMKTKKLTLALDVLMLALIIADIVFVLKRR